MKRKEKFRLLSRLIALQINLGYNIDYLIGKPLSYFDFDKIKIQIEKMKIETATMNGQTIEEYKSLELE